MTGANIEDNQTAISSLICRRGLEVWRPRWGGGLQRRAVKADLSCGLMLPGMHGRVSAHLSRETGVRDYSHGALDAGDSLSRLDRGEDDYITKRSIARSSRKCAHWAAAAGKKRCTPKRSCMVICASTSRHEVTIRESSSIRPKNGNCGNLARERARVQPWALVERAFARLEALSAPRCH